MAVAVDTVVGSPAWIARDQFMERYWRDTRLGVPGGGSDDTLRELLARSYGL